MAGEKRGYMLLVRNRNYRMVFSASAISNLGDGVSALALPWLATLLTRDAMLVATVAMAQRLPWFLLSLPAGVWLVVLPPRAPQPTVPFKAVLFEGMRWMRGNRVILQLAVMLGVVNACHMAGLTVLILYAQEVLRLDAFGTGVLMTIGATGSVLGGLIAPRLCRRIGLRGSMIIGLIAFAMHYALFTVTGSPAAAGLGLAIGGFGAMVWNVATVSFRQRSIPDDILGRVNSIYRFFGWGAMPLGALAGGALVTLMQDDWGRDAALRLPFGVATAGIGLVLAYALIRLRVD
jgi:Na+/melibiose symporter-like transporter